MYFPLILNTKIKGTLAVDIVFISQAHIPSESAHITLISPWNMSNEKKLTIQKNSTKNIAKGN